MLKILVIVGVACLVGAALLIGGGGALCRWKYNCHIHGDANRSDAELLDAFAQRDRKAPPARLEAGFVDSVVAGSLGSPTDFAFLPDGSVLVAERSGKVVLLRPGKPRVTALDLRSKTSSTLFRGLVAIAADPEFDRNRFFYVVYSTKPASGGASGPTSVHLSRFALGATKASPQSERVLLGRVTGRSCTDLPATADCIPSDVDHLGAQISFTKGGLLVVSTGDGGGHDDEIEETALRAQDVDSLGGKVLRVTRDGLGVRENPFWNGKASANRSKVWALGLRNPFRSTLIPGSYTPVVGDVGRSKHEEVDVVPRGANLGWPCVEGHDPVSVYAGTDTCLALSHSGTRLQPPLVTIPHPDGASITGGAFYVGTAYPARFRNAYFFGDWAAGWLRYVRIGPNGSIIGRAEPFGTRLPGPSAIHMGPDGALYYAAFNAGELRRIGWQG